MQPWWALEAKKPQLNIKPKLNKFNKLENIEHTKTKIKLKMI